MKRRLLIFLLTAALAALAFALPALADPAEGEGTASNPGAAQPGTDPAPDGGSGAAPDPDEGNREEGSGTPEGTDPTPGAQPGQSGTVPGADPEGDAADPDAEGTDPADPTQDPDYIPDLPDPGQQKPYSNLTPVDSAGNNVNTHQLPDSSFLYDTSLDDLANATYVYDNQTVQIVGEVVGDLISAGVGSNHVWVTLASTDAASDATVTVYMSTSMVKVIDTLGEYGKTGTILQVRGTFHLACRDHSGTSDIHVENVAVVSPGTEAITEFHLGDFLPGLVLVVFAGVLCLVLYVLRQRLR